MKDFIYGAAASQKHEAPEDVKKLRIHAAEEISSHISAKREVRDLQTMFQLSWPLLTLTGEKRGLTVHESRTPVGIDKTANTHSHGRHEEKPVAVESGPRVSVSTVLALIAGFHC